MSKLADYFADRGVDLDEDDLILAFDRLIGDRLQPSDQSALTDAETDMLRRYSGVPEPDPEVTRAVLAASVASAAMLVSEAPTTSELARQLGVDSSRVRHLAAEGSLYVLRGVGRENRYPRWQFTGQGRPLPGLKELLDALPTDIHPLAVLGFVSTPQPELEVGDRVVTPIEWLAAGGDPAPVAELATSLGMPH